MASPTAAAKLKSGGAGEDGETSKTEKVLTLSLVQSSQRLRDAVAKDDIELALLIAFAEFRFMPGYRDMLVEYVVELRERHARVLKQRRAGQKGKVKLPPLQVQSSSKASVPDAIVFNMIIRTLIDLANEEAQRKTVGKMPIAMHPELVREETLKLAEEAAKDNQRSAATSSSDAVGYTPLPTPAQPFGGLFNSTALEDQMLNSIKRSIDDFQQQQRQPQQSQPEQTPKDATSDKQAAEIVAEYLKELDSEPPKPKAWSDSGVLTALRTLDYMQYLATHPKAVKKLQLGDGMEDLIRDADQDAAPKVNLSLAPDVRSFIPIARVAGAAGDAILGQALIVRLHKWNVLRRTQDRKEKPQELANRAAQEEELRLALLQALASRSPMSLDRYTIFMTLWDALQRDQSDAPKEASEPSEDGEWPTWLWPPQQAFEFHPAFTIADNPKMNPDGSDIAAGEGKEAKLVSEVVEQITYVSPPSMLYRVFEGQADQDGDNEKKRFTKVPILHALGQSPADFAARSVTSIFTSYTWPQVWAGVFDSARSLSYLERCAQIMLASARSADKSGALPAVPRHPAVQWATSPGRLAKLIAFVQTAPRNLSELYEALALAARREAGVTDEEPERRLDTLYAQAQSVFTHENVQNALRLCSLMTLHSFGLMLPNVLPDPVPPQLAVSSPDLANKIRKEVAEAHALVTQLTAQRRKLLDLFLVQTAAEFNLVATRAIWSRPNVTKAPVDHNGADKTSPDSQRKGFVPSALSLEQISSDKISNIYWPLSKRREIESVFESIPRLRLAYPDPMWFIQNRTSREAATRVVVEVAYSRNDEDVAVRSVLLAQRAQLLPSSLTIAVESNPNRAASLVRYLVQDFAEMVAAGTGLTKQLHTLKERHPRHLALGQRDGLLSPELPVLTYPGQAPGLLGALPISSVDVIRFIHPQAGVAFAQEQLLLAARALRVAGRAYIITSDGRLTRQLTSLFADQLQSGTKWRGLPVFNGAEDVAAAVLPSTEAKSEQSIARAEGNLSRLFRAFELMDETDDNIGSFSNYTSKTKKKGKRKNEEQDEEDSELASEMKIRCYMLVRTAEEWE